MIATITKRLLQAVPTLFGVSILVFVLLVTTGDPIRQLLGPDAGIEEQQKLRKELHLDRHPIVQYGFWLGKVARGDFGISYSTQRAVLPDLKTRMIATAELAVVTMVIATLVAISVALLSVRRPGGWFDSIARTAIFVFLAMPAFWLGIELIILFSRKLLLLPPAGRGEGSLRDHIAHLIMPAFTLGIGTGALLCRVLRASLLEVLHSDYLRTARAKGLAGGTVLLRHALRNALIPFVTLSGLSIAILLEGAVIVETVFAWPGMGSWLIEAIKGRDAPVVMAAVLMIAVIYTLINLLVDVLYVVIDPRVRLDGGSK